MKKLLLATALVILPCVAQARTWYVLNAGHDRCDTTFTASTHFGVPFTSPEDFIRVVSREGTYTGVQATRAKNGALMMVGVKLRFNDGSKTVIVFTPELVVCQALLKMGEQDGSIVPPDALR